MFSHYSLLLFSEINVCYTQRHPHAGRERARLGQKDDQQKGGHYGGE